MRTPLGFERQSSAAAFRAGISVIGDHPFMIDRFGLPMKVTRDPELPIELSGAERLAQLALPAIRSAVAPIFGRDVKVSLLVNFGEVRPGHSKDDVNTAMDLIRAELSDAVNVDRVGSWMGGHAGGLIALHHGIELVRSGKSELVLAGGVDSYLDADTLEWLDEIEQLHSEGNIYGFCPGEAAGFVLLAGPRHNGLGINILGTGVGQEENLIKTEDIVLGEGLAQAFHEASAPLPDGARVNQILCDMNGERYRGNEYGFAALRVAGLFENAADFETPADCWGDVGAASGPLYVGLAIEAEARGYAKGPLTMIWASSEAGRRAAAILGREGFG